jgi:hypothetical protein
VRPKFQVDGSSPGRFWFFLPKSIFALCVGGGGAACGVRCVINRYFYIGGLRAVCVVSLIVWRAMRRESELVCDASQLTQEQWMEKMSQRLLFCTDCDI